VLFVVELSTEVDGFFHVEVGGFVAFTLLALRSFLAVRPCTRVLFGDALRFVRSCGHGLATLLHGLLSWGSSIPFRQSPPLRPLPVQLHSLRNVAFPSDRTLPGPISFRSCRSSRLQRFPPQELSSRTKRALAARRFVAPCSRPWGSPCFQCVGTLRLRRPRGRARSEDRAAPFPMASTLRSFSLPGSLPLVTAFLPKKDCVHRGVVPSRR